MLAVSIICMCRYQFSYVDSLSIIPKDSELRVIGNSFGSCSYKMYLCSLISFCCIGQNNIFHFPCFNSGIVGSNQGVTFCILGTYLQSQNCNFTVFFNVFQHTFVQAGLNCQYTLIYFEVSNLNIVCTSFSICFIFSDEEHVLFFQIADSSI